MTLKTLFFSSSIHCHIHSNAPLAFLSWALLNQLPARGHKEQPGKWWMSSRLGSDRFLKRCLVCADLHCFFFFLIIHSRPTAGSGGCHGDQWPAWRVITRLASLWLLAQTNNWKSQILYVGWMERMETTSRLINAALAELHSTRL